MTRRTTPSLEVSCKKWEDIICNFVVKLPKTKKGNDAIWVVADRLTQSTHFIPVKMTIYMNKLVQH